MRLLCWEAAMLSMLCLTSFVCNEAVGFEFDLDSRQQLEKSFPYITETIVGSHDEGRKKKKKMGLKEIITIGMLIKSALMPLTVGFLKLLTGKALFVTMMALGLILSITFGNAAKKTTKTEVINLVGHGHKRALDEISLEVLKVVNSPPWGD